MARMHSRNKGKSGSTKPVEKKLPEWVSINKKELELLITKMAKEGKSSAQIGLNLRDSYGIPDAKLILGKGIYSFMREKELNKNLPEDLLALMARVFTLRKHFSSNKQDTSAKRGIQLTDSKINRLVKYYKEEGCIETDFKYKPSELNLYLQ